MMLMLTIVPIWELVLMYSGSQSAVRTSWWSGGRTGWTLYLIEVKEPSGPRLLVDGPSDLLDFIIHALRALSPCDPRNDAVIRKCGVSLWTVRIPKKSLRNPKIFTEKLKTISPRNSNNCTERSKKNQQEIQKNFTDNSKQKLKNFFRNSENLLKI